MTSEQQDMIAERERLKRNFRELFAELSSDQKAAIQATIRQLDSQIKKAA